MQTVRDLDSLRRTTGEWRTESETIALVPTMGALHDGHLALVTAAKARADRVVASIFVNPLQFNDKADLDRYPRQEREDVAKFADAGVDLVWAPAVDDLYPHGFATKLSVSGISQRWEGEHRPGHFDGVATVVAKLLIGAMPDAAFFGEKDFQQLALIRRMALDLGLPVEVIGVPTVRAADGLALSSRNALLTSEQRNAAPALSRALGNAARVIGFGESAPAALDLVTAELEEAGFGPIDYVAYVDEGSLDPVDHYIENGRIIAAAFLGKIRLIDNMRVVRDTE
nr:pantoate--beta-alanine ligase [uncultured Sphingomonas sp.]